MSTGTPTPPSRAWLRALPKAELHVHLDGSLRPETMLDLAAERDVVLPAADPEALGAYMVVSDAASLEEYLERFAITLSVMQDAEAIERITYECVIDHALEGVWYAEIRFCPLLNTEGGLNATEVTEAALAGVRRAEEDVRAGALPQISDLHAGPPSISSALILCGLRSHTPKQTLEVAELAVAYRDRGVVAFDLAGPESGYPVHEHLAAFDTAHRGGVPITIHAGEGYGPESIREALTLGHARRIGHGTRLHEDRALLDTVRRLEIPLEVCLTSNVQTRVVDEIRHHPAWRYRLAGVPIALSTDNRLMSGVSLTDEYERAVATFGLTHPEVTGLARAAFEHAFVSDDRRADYLHRFDARVDDLGRL